MAAIAKYVCFFNQCMSNEMKPSNVGLKQEAQLAC